MNEDIKSIRRHLIKYGSVFLEPYSHEECPKLFEQMKVIKTETYDTFEVHSEEIILVAPELTDYNPMYDEIEQIVKKNYPLSIAKMTNVTKQQVDSTDKDLYMYQNSYTVSFYELDKLDMEEIEDIYIISEKLKELTDGSVCWVEHQGDGHFYIKNTEAHAEEIYKQWKNLASHIPLYLWLNLNSDILEKYQKSMLRGLGE